MTIASFNLKHCSTSLLTVGGAVAVNNIFGTLDTMGKASFPIHWKSFLNVSPLQND